MIDEEICFEKEKVASSFNHFFTTVASNLVSKLPIGSNNFGRNCVFDYYSSKGITPNSFSLQNVSEEKIRLLLKGICSKKATGLDNLPAKFIRDAAEEIVKPITHIVNLSVNTSTVPDELKTARVVPLFKKNNSLEVGNYRPVSIVCIIKNS